MFGKRPSCVRGVASRLAASAEDVRGRRPREPVALAHRLLLGSLAADPVAWPQQGAGALAC
jgi:hypothetical protein